MLNPSFIYSDCPVHIFIQPIPHRINSHPTTSHSILSLIPKMQRFSESEATLCRECEQKDMLIKELEEEKAALLKQCELKATLLKQCEEQKATLLKQCERKDTLLQWCKEQMTMSFERSERQKAAFLREFEQEKAELPKLRLYEEWRYKPSEYSKRMEEWAYKPSEYSERMDKWLNEALQKDREIMDQKVEQNPDLFLGSFWPFCCIRLLIF